MSPKRWIAVLAGAALIGLALTLIGAGGELHSTASESHAVGTPPVMEAQPAPLSATTTVPPTPPEPNPKPKPPLVGPGDLAPKPAPLNPAKLVRVTPGPITLGAKGFAHAADLCLRNTGGVALHWALGTDVLFKSSPLFGDVAGGDATCLKVWTVSPLFNPGMTAPLVIDSSANSVSIDVRLAD